MTENLRFVGLDVHAETIAVVVAEPDGGVRSLGTIPNRAESIRKMLKKLGPAETEVFHFAVFQPRQPPSACFVSASRSAT
jgi:hypothetical protein